VEVDADSALDRGSARPWVLAFFHGTQWPLLAWRRRRLTQVMVSWSLDGSLQARALRTLGFSVVRGSSSRGGLRALAEMTRRLRKTEVDAAFAVDGPRGPYGDVHGGARVAARAAGGVLVPMGAAFARGMVFERTWDRFALAWPFSRVVVCLGPPLEPSSPEGTNAALGAAIQAANTRAAARLHRQVAVEATQAG
jgi:hypothetical protein